MFNCSQTVGGTTINSIFHMNILSIYIVYFLIGITKDRLFWYMVHGFYLVWNCISLNYAGVVLITVLNTELLSSSINTPGSIATMMDVHFNMQSTCTIYVNDFRTMLILIPLQTEDVKDYVNHSTWFKVMMHI